MKECNSKSRIKQQNLNELDYVHNVRHVKAYAPRVKGILKGKNVLMLICKIDAQKCELDLAQDKFPEHQKQIDVKARYCFGKGVGAGTLKCI